MVDIEKDGIIDITPKEEGPRGILAKPLRSSDLVAQVNLIQDVMKSVMKSGIHYGKIPGTPKETLLKPGAEKLLSAFRIASTVAVEDLSTEDVCRYRVTASATHAPSGVYLGDAMGEASTDEEKYRWRAAVCKDEWEDTPVDRRRLKYKKGRDKKIYTVEQIRTNPADLANTVLKMAVKRAEVALTLKVTGCSDIFSQDFEEWTPEMLDALGYNEADTPFKQPRKKKKAAPKKAEQPPKEKAKPKKDEPRPKAAFGPDEDEEEPDKGEAPPLTDSDAPQWADEDPGDFSDLDEDEEEEEEEEDEDDDVLTARIDAAVEVKSGVASTGREWTLYRVEAAGDRYSTFDQSIYEKAAQALEDGALCKIKWTKHEKGLNIVGLEVIG